MFNRALNQPLGYYVWEVAFGKFNSFFQKFIHPLEMYIVECYIYICYRATKMKKNFLRIILYASITEFDCSPYPLFPTSINKNCELYFYTQWPLALILQSCYACYTFVYLCYSVLCLLP